MTTPHEYYDKDYGEWNLHSYHNSRLYEDPDMDYIANEADDQLPLLSTIGAGPQGAGIKVETENSGEHFVIKLISDQTNEVVAQTPNMHPGHPVISHDDPELWHENQNGRMHIAWVRDGEEAYSYDVPIPHGAHGSRIYLSQHVQDDRADKTYTETTADLYIYGLQTWKRKPVPRPNDIVIFPLRKNGSYMVAFGTIEAVEGNDGRTAVGATTTWTSRTEVGFPMPYINKDGNWHVTINDEDIDTGVTARGPKGKQGDPGPKGDDGGPGPQGDPGIDAAIVIDEVRKVASDKPAKVIVTKDPCPNLNTYHLVFEIPMGERGPIGPAINIIGEINDWDWAEIDKSQMNTGDAYLIHFNERTEADLYIRNSNPNIESGFNIVHDFKPHEPNRGEDYWTEFDKESIRKSFYREYVASPEEIQEIIEDEFGFVEA